MGAFIDTSDLAPFATIDQAKAEAMIDDAEARATLVAPCILSGEFQADTGKMAAVKAILRAALLRWNDSGSGALTQQTAGPFNQSIDTRQGRKAMFWPSEIEDLQGLCSTSGAGAFDIDTVPGLGPCHAPACNIYFGRDDCSCGAALTGGEPLYERES